VAHLPLKKEQRQQVAVRISAGIPYDDVLDGVHVDAEDTDVEPDVPEVGFYASLIGHQLTEPDVTESEAILGNRSQPQNCANTARYVKTAELAWSKISLAMDKNPQIAETVVEHITRLESLVTAMSEVHDSERVLALLSHEPANKKAIMQRYSADSGKTSGRQHVTSSTSKLNKSENELLLKSFEGNDEVISSRPPADHDYVIDIGCHAHNFETGQQHAAI